MTLLTRKALIVSAVGAFLLWVAWFAGQRQAALLVLSGSTMGTTWQVQVVDDGSLRLQDLDAAIPALLGELDRGIFSTWAEDSELSRLNARDDGAPVQVSPALFEVVEAALEVYTKSGGAFDASIGPLIDLWGFGPQPAAGEPDAAAVAAARARLGMDALRLDAASSSVRKPPRVQLDLSGIAKGYAVDRVAALLQEQGATHFLVEIGGELRLQGRRPDGSAWRIAIEVPDPLQRTTHALLDSGGRAMALAGSGDYRNFRLVDGQRQSHEIDPATGAPVRHALAAVTVLADTAMTADAWATALMVLGPEQGIETAVRLGLSAYFIMRAGDGWQSRHTGAFASHLVSDQQDALAANAVQPAKE